MLREGENCWRRVRAERCAFLIDADAYFDAFVAAAQRARRSIVIAGWDFNGQVELWRDDRATNLPNRIGEFLRALVERHSDLRVYILEWDFAALYALDRELLPRYRMDWRDHERIRFELDGCHPTGCSHHQKIVVIDDSIAFVGGLDFGPGRWDTSRHAAADPRRTDCSGDGYPPFHDAQMAVEGEAALAVGELVRERWRGVTGWDLPEIERAADLWPPSLDADIEDVDVAIARTLPAYEGREEVREVERSYVESIERAKRIVYIENQYLTAAAVGDAIERRLGEADGPEFVVVVRKQCSGWLEHNVMATLRAHLVTRLEKADRFGHLHVYYPQSDDQAINVHAKLMIVDDELARVGSANLNNRSMGVDSECDLIVEAREREDVRCAIAALLDRLLAEHLGVEPAAVEAAVERCGNYAAAIAALSSEGSGRRLIPLEVDADLCSDEVLSATCLADPEKPLDLDTIAAALGMESQSPARGALWAAFLTAAAAAFVATAWHWSVFGAAVNASVH